MLILAFGHKARNGKDTAGEALFNYYTQHWLTALKHGIRSGSFPFPVIFKFAEALYEEARTLHGMTAKDAALLQRIGSERRAEDPDYWIKKCFEAIDRKHPGIALITDLRYQNEAAAVKARGGFTIDVTRLNQDGSRYIADDRPSDHPSEIDLDGHNFDYYITAKTGEVALIAQQVITLAEFIRGSLRIDR